MDETSLKEIVTNIKFSARQVDRKECPWDKCGYRPHWLLILSYQGKRVQFDFWNNMENCTPKKIESLSLLLDEACDAQYDLDELAKEFGIDKPSEANRIYKGVQATYKKLTNLLNLTSDEDLFDLANYVRDQT